MKRLSPGDVVITPTVNWLSRDTTDLLVIAREMQRAGAGIRSLAEPCLNTTSDFAEIVFAILGVAAKLERRRILERTARGRADARAKGVKFGRKPIRPRTNSKRPASASKRCPQLECQPEHDFEAFGMTSPAHGFPTRSIAWCANTLPSSCSTAITRHTPCAPHSSALENGAQLEDVQKAAGHRDPGTTKLYDRRGCNPEKATSFFATY
jgi:hypothetical protein